MIWLFLQILNKWNEKERWDAKQEYYVENQKRLSRIQERNLLMIKERNFRKAFKSKFLKTVDKFGNETAFHLIDKFEEIKNSKYIIKNQNNTHKTKFTKGNQLKVV